MKIKKIYINFEGVLADFEGRIKELWGVEFSEKNSAEEEENRFWEQFQEKIDNENNFYESLEPIPGSLEMVNKLLETYKNICEIVSDDHSFFRWSSEGLDKEAIEKEFLDKTSWINKYLPKNIWFDSTGAYFPSDGDAGYILIDHRERKIEKWRNEGGTGILFRSPQETLAELKDIEESFYRQSLKSLSDKLEQSILDCKEKADKIYAHYMKGILTEEDLRSGKYEVARKAWSEIEKFCENEGINLKGEERDDAYQAVYTSSGIPIAKVPIRYYPTVEWLGGSLYYFHGIENADSILYDDNPIGKTYKLKKTAKMGEEDIKLDYIFEIIREDYELEKEGSKWEGWRCFSGYGLLEGYGYRDGSINVREHEGEVQAIAFQKTYVNPFDPIWKRRSTHPVTGYRWLGFEEELPENLEIPEGGFYYDATTETQPLRGMHYKKQGILAYDDTDEIVILGITDWRAEIVEIPREINGKPVTVLDEQCFENCHLYLRKVILPDTLKEIGDCAFMSCDKLEKPVIPASVTKIGKDIFKYTKFEAE